MLYLDAYDYSYPETALKKTARDYVDIVANGQNLIEMLVEKMKGGREYFEPCYAACDQSGKKYGVFSGQTLYEASGSCILPGSRDYE